MATATKTLKLPFLRLNKAKADEFARLQVLNTEVANSILAMPKDVRAALTSKHFNTIEIGSAWINQTIRNARAKTKVRCFASLPLETNNQNWTLHKTGGTFSVGFGLLRGIKKRVPLAVHQAVHAGWLEAILDANAGRNIGQWTGMFCAFDPSKASSVILEAGLAHGVYGGPPNLVSDANPSRLA